MSKQRTHSPGENEPTKFDTPDNGLNPLSNPPNEVSESVAENPKVKKPRKLVNLSPRLAALNAVEKLFGEHDPAHHEAMIRHAAETFAEYREREVKDLIKQP